MDDRTRHQPQSGSDLEQDDLEVDCVPCFPAHSNSDSIHSRKHPGKAVQDERFDSGLDSLDLQKQSHASLDSIGTSINSQLRNLQISKQSDNFGSEKCQSVCISDDLGYCGSGSLPLSVEEKIQQSHCPGVETKTVPGFEDQIFSQDDDGDTQLHMVVIQLLEDVAVLFIDNVSDAAYLDIQNLSLQTPLHLGVITRQPRTVRRLITAGADLALRDNKGNTPLHIAAKEGYTETAYTLLEPIHHEEVQNNSYNIPYHKIPQDLEARNYDGQTCLHLAAEGTHLQVLQLLIIKGANINAQDGKSGRTILHYGAEMGNLPLVQFLLRQPNININAKTYGGLTPVMLANGRGFQQIVTYLRQNGAQDDSSSEESSSDSDDEMSDDSYDDFCIGGQPVQMSPP